MTLSQEKYNTLKNNKKIKPLVKLLTPRSLLTKNKEEQQALDRKIRNMNQSWLNEWICMGDDIYKKLANNISFSMFLGFDSIELEELGRKISALKKVYKNLYSNKRVGHKKQLYERLRLLFWAFNEMGIRQVNQIDFVYQLFIENNYEDYGLKSYFDKKGRLIDEPAQKERIRKMQEKAILELKKM